MNEYELLRAEFIHNSESIVQYENMMYASVAAILAFAAQAENYLLCLAAYVIIIPCFFVIMNRKKSTCFIATYMYVFLEGEDKQYHWEQRSYEYNADGNIFGFSDATSDWKLNFNHYPWKLHVHFFLLPIIVSCVTVFFTKIPPIRFTISCCGIIIISPRRRGLCFRFLYLSSRSPKPSP